MCISELYLLCAQKMQYVEINSCTYCFTTFTDSLSNPCYQLSFVSHSVFWDSGCINSRIIIPDSQTFQQQLCGILVL